MIHVYVLEDKFGSIYVGITNDLDRRLAEHRRGACATTGKLAKSSLSIIHDWLIPSFSLASRFERYLHTLTKSDLLDIITDCPLWNDLLKECAESKTLQRFEEAKDLGTVHDNKYDIVSLPNKELLSRMKLTN